MRVDEVAPQQHLDDVLGLVEGVAQVRLFLGHYQRLQLLERGQRDVAVAQLLSLADQETLVHAVREDDDDAHDQ